VRVVRDCVGRMQGVQMLQVVYIVNTRLYRLVVYIVTPRLYRLLRLQ